MPRLDPHRLQELPRLRRRARRHLHRRHRRRQRLDPDHRAHRTRRRSDHPDDRRRHDHRPPRPRRRQSDETPAHPVHRLPPPLAHHRRPRPHHRRPPTQEESRPARRHQSAAPRCASKKSMELLFIRHALPLRVEGFEGPADPELSEAGQHQARHLAEYLAFERIHAVFASPLRRAVQTAEPVAAKQSIEVTIADGHRRVRPGGRRSTSRSSSSRRRACRAGRTCSPVDVHRTAGVDPARVPRRRRRRRRGDHRRASRARRWPRSATAASSTPT